ncbi:MAG: S-methyl-5-thioribose-1-phosphate isomerase [Planctomycetota bacterium]|jgi:methylthioribose-1-phosphate isomerase
MSETTLHPRTIRWEGDIDGHVVLIDQTRLPHEELDLPVEDPETMIDAIVRLAVRGAPAIGVAGAYGVCLATRGLEELPAVRDALTRALPLLRDARPTAVNLATMVDRMETLLRERSERPGMTGMELRRELLAEARRIHEEDADLCRRIGEAGAPLVAEGASVLTHCNAGALATAGSGTALSVLFEAWARGTRFQVFADETRPLLQGARLTSWELARAGIPVTVICDNAAAHLMARGEITQVITGADRIAANGDAANKIGTYGVAAVAARHAIPFHVAAPSTTFDLETPTGDRIPIEERSPDEVWGAVGGGPPPEGVRFRNPAFDVTPAALVAGWVTEHGVLQPPFAALR